LTIGGTANYVAFASRLPNGNTLIADGGNARVVEVDSNDKIVWEFYTNSTVGSNSDPGTSRAVRLQNGQTVISDQNNNRVIYVDSAGTIVQSFGIINQPGFSLTNTNAGLNGPYDAKVICDFTGLTDPGVPCSSSRIVTVGVTQTSSGPRWIPDDILILEGDYVNFTDLFGGVHFPVALKVAGDCSPSNELQIIFNCSAGANFCLAGPFDSPGVIDYKCTPHCQIGMLGRITVQPLVFDIGVVPGQNRWIPDNPVIVEGSFIQFTDLGGGYHVPIAMNKQNDCSSRNELRDLFACLGVDNCTVGPFNNAGTINFKCLPHCALGMVGQILVIPPGKAANSSFTTTTGNPFYWVWIHGGLMGATWMGLVPLSIYVARYMKRILGVWWFRVHAVLGCMILAVCTAGFIIIQAKFYKPIDYNKAHVICGLIVFIGMYLQVILGVAINYLYKADRKNVPWWDQLHWWAGRALFILSLVTVPLGLSYYASDRYLNGDDDDQGSFIAYGVATFVILFIFAGTEIIWRARGGHKDEEKGV
jgi:plastocyanin